MALRAVALRSGIATILEEMECPRRAASQKKALYPIDRSAYAYGKEDDSSLALLVLWSTPLLWGVRLFCAFTGLWAFS